ncbi:MAG: PAC2 family protein [Dehalococcoidia bacterium]|nr:PAC2 family protein [Dehalococcoidia bacterium]
MSVRIFKKPNLENPVMIAGWPGIGNIGIIAVHTLREILKAEEFAEIEPWDFFYPRKMDIKNGELLNMEFPDNKFYFKSVQKRDIMFFIGDEQPAEGRVPYAEGRKAYQIANLVLDVAVRFGCRRVYTSGAAVSAVHHTAKPRVLAVPNKKELIPEIKGYPNTILMSAIEGREGQGSITGLNGLLLGMARNRGLEGICLMGEIPLYLQGLPIPYPKASRSVLEVLCNFLGIKIGMRPMDLVVERSEKEIENIYGNLPPEVKRQIEKLKDVPLLKQAEPVPITEEDKKKILEDIDKFFKKDLRED